MNRNLIKRLAEESLTRGSLDENKVIKITKKLSRENLKNYIKALKEIDAKSKIVVFIPSESKDSIKHLVDSLKNTFPGKKVVIKIDPELMLGMRIIDNDNIYEYSLKDFFDRTLKGATT